jgi:superfamily I DNA and/or RNA helicase
LDELETALEQLGAYFPVWVVTNLSVRNALPLRPALFDLVIVDEASQCDVASAVPLLYRAKRSAIIGDPNQLQHITSIDEKEEQQIARRNGAAHLLPRWSYAGQSLYGAAERAARDRGNPPILLRRHYRSHPAIIGFSNRQFYGGRLRGMRSGDSFDVPGEWRGVRWFDVRGSVPEGISSAYNDAEINATLSLLKHWLGEGLLTRGDLSVGVVTPFRAQTDRLEERLRRQDWWEEVRSQLQIERPVTVGTAHRFQGDERDLMIFSPVVAPGIKTYTERWVATTDQLLNVAITRARASLQVVGHHSRCRGAGGALGEFAAYVGRHDLVQADGRHRASD